MHHEFERQSMIRPKHMSQDEAKRIMELWAQRQQEAEQFHLITVSDVAEALRIPESEVEGMLGAVRRLPEPTGAINEAEPTTSMMEDLASAFKTICAFVCFLSLIVASLFFWDLLAGGYRSLDNLRVAAIIALVTAPAIPGRLKRWLKPALPSQGRRVSDGRP